MRGRFSMFAVVYDASRPIGAGRLVSDQYRCWNVFEGPHFPYAQISRSLCSSRVVRGKTKWDRPVRFR